MAASDLVNLSGLLDDAKCFTLVRQHRWPDTISRCGCGCCASTFMGLNLSNRQIALELGLSPSDVQAMTEHLRRGLVAKAPAVRLEGEVEIDEVYVVAGHKGQPAAVAKRGDLDAVAGWPVPRAGARGRRTSPRSSA